VVVLLRPILVHICNDETFDHANSELLLSDPSKRLVLGTLLEKLIGALCESISSVPAEARQVFDCVSTVVSARFEGAQHGVVCGLFIERLLVPALGKMCVCVCVFFFYYSLKYVVCQAQPVSFGVLDEDLEPTHARIVDVLRTALGRFACPTIVFPDASPLSFLNSMLQQQQQHVWDFIANISVYDRFSVSQYGRASSVSKLVLQTAAMDLHAILATHLPVLEKVTTLIRFEFDTLLTIVVVGYRIL
jgi:hypothetical protein